MLIAHIGSWKTATTALQFVLRKEKERLRNNNVNFIDTRERWFSSEFIPLFKEYVRAEAKGVEDLAKMNESITYFCEKSRVFDFKTNILSWEAALGHPFNSSSKTMYHPETTAKWLANLQTKLNLKVSFVIRDQLDFVESMYAQEVRKGRYQESFSMFVNERLPKNLGWSPIIQALHRHGIVENLRVLDYDAMKNDVHHFFSSIAWNCLDFNGLNLDSRKNLSLSKKAIEIMRRCIPLVDKEELKLIEIFLVENFSISSSSLERLSNLDDKNIIRSRAVESLDIKEICNG